MTGADFLSGALAGAGTTALGGAVTVLGAAFAAFLAAFPFLRPSASAGRATQTDTKHNTKRGIIFIGDWVRDLGDWFVCWVVGQGGEGHLIRGFVYFAYNGILAGNGKGVGKGRVENYNFIRL